MATVKAVSSKVSVGGAIDYVTKKEKTEEKLISGFNCEPETVKDEMQTTKEMWGKTDGRTYKHFTQNFHKDENITHEQAHAIAKKFVEQCPLFKGFEILIATHKDRKHIHTHFIVNSVNFETGYKFRMSSRDLDEMKKLSDEICKEHNLTICEKGKTFEGEKRESIVAYDKDTYQVLKKSEDEMQRIMHGDTNQKLSSYIYDIADAVQQLRGVAVSREDFIQRMMRFGYDVEWSDTRKYITFVDVAGLQRGEKKCKVRNNKLEQYFNIDFSKETLEKEFSENARFENEIIAAQDDVVYIEEDYVIEPEAVSAVVEPIEQQPVEIPRPDFKEIVTAHRDVKLKETVLKEAKSHIFEEREVRYNIIKVPEQLRSALNLMWNAYSVQQDVVQQIAALHRPIEPKGLFVLKSKKEQYEKAYAAYKTKLAPLQEHKRKAEIRLQECFEVLQEYLRPSELQRQGYGSNAPIINPVAMDDRDMYQIQKMVTHRIENKHDGYQMLADREQRLAIYKEGAEAAQNDLNLAQERFDELMDKIPEEYKEEAKQAVREADRVDAEQERTPQQQKEKGKGENSDHGSR